MSAPERFVEWINGHVGFNPRAQQSSDALARLVAGDLTLRSPSLAADLASGRAIMRLNAAVGTRITERDVGLVFLDPGVPGPLNRARLAVENKSIMTAHGKARKNRYGDVIAYANHLHNHSGKGIAAALVVVNVNPGYRNPDPSASAIARRYPNMGKIVADTVGLFAGIPLRELPDEPFDQPEAVAVVVLDYDGIGEASLVTDPRPRGPGSHPITTPSSSGCPGCTRPGTRPRTLPRSQTACVSVGGWL